MLIPWILITLLLMLLYGIAVVKLFRSRLTGSGIFCFLTLGGALALIRITLLWFSYYRFQMHTYTTPVLSYVFLPENAVIYPFNIRSPELHAILLTILLIIGSFFWLFPLLLIGARRKVAHPQT